MSATQIHPTAIVSPGAELGLGVEIGPYALIGPRVKIHDRCKIAAHAHISGITEVGEDSQVFAFATVGATPQDLKYQGEETSLRIGKRNLIREYVNISIGTVTGSGLTSLGDDNLLMCYTHVAHDVVIGNHCILANGVQIAGHVEIGDHAVFGGMSGAHQFCRIGPFAMIAAGSIVVQDVLPFCMAQGDRAVISGLNVVGIKRHGFAGAAHSRIKEIFRLIFKSQLSVEEALSRVQAEVSDAKDKEIIVQFLQKGTRGLCR